MYHSLFWAMDTAGWQIENSPSSLFLIPGDVDAALSVVGIYCEDPMTMAALSRTAEEGKPAGIELVQAQCGDFVGFYADHMVVQEDGDLYVRQWWLLSGQVYIYAFYNCAYEDAHQHGGVVDWMLSTLQEKTKDGSNS